MPPTQTLIVISGGTGCNALTPAFLPPHSTSTSFILPISDDGGSSSEIQRVLGGPAIGDIRSRLVRLIPDSAEGTPLAAIRNLLEYRLGTGSSVALKGEWHGIVEGRHKLWKGIPTDRKECIRAFLIHFESAVLKKAQRGFNWKRASVGNIFLTGASMYLGSENDEIIVGQSEISHPSGSNATHQFSTPSRPTTPLPTTSSFNLFPPPSPAYNSRAPTPALFEGPILGDEETHSDYQGSGSEEEEEREGRNGNVVFDKDNGEVEGLRARIRRIFYINAYGSETFPRANPLFLDSLATSSCLVYSCGSLYTSIIPCLALRGVGYAIQSSPSLRHKILLLNGTRDRETPGYSAVDFVEAIRKALCDYGGGMEGRWKASEFM
ncbi:hypothetical protein P7C70_g8238, partial [Phenoliferia sp. Uapishka_3]